MTGPADDLQRTLARAFEAARAQLHAEVARLVATLTPAQIDRLRRIVRRRRR